MPEGIIGFGVNKEVPGNHPFYSYTPTLYSLKNIKKMELSSLINTESFLCVIG